MAWKFDVDDFAAEQHFEQQESNMIIRGYTHEDVYFQNGWFAVYTENGKRLGAFPSRDLAELFAKAVKEQPKRVRLMAGNHHVHIVRDGQPLCGRSRWQHGDLSETTKKHPTCPGCSAKSMGAVAREAGV